MFKVRKPSKQQSSSPPGCYPVTSQSPFLIRKPQRSMAEVLFTVLQRKITHYLFLDIWIVSTTEVISLLRVRFCKSCEGLNHETSFTVHSSSSASARGRCPSPGVQTQSPCGARPAQRAVRAGSLTF